MIHVYTGNGKGKTTAALGLILRALGHKRKVCLIQFLKKPKSGEILFLRKHKSVKVFCFGREGFCVKDKLGLKDFILAKAGLNKAKEILKEYKPDILVLDELNLILHFGLLEKKEILPLLKGISKKTEVVVTGRHASSEVIKAADLVSDIREVKHYYKQGLASRKSIEY